MTSRQETYRAGVDYDRGPAKITDRPGRGGRTYYDRKTCQVLEISVPRPTNAYTRTVRLHELVHAQRMPRERPLRGISDQAYQLLLDLEAHTQYWPRTATKAQERDALATGLIDLRQHQQHGTSLAKKVYVAARASAILRGLSRPYFRRVFKSKLFKRLDKLVGNSLCVELTDIVDRVANSPSPKKRRELATRLEALLGLAEEIERQSQKMRYGAEAVARDESTEPRELKPALDCSAAMPEMHLEALPLIAPCREVVAGPIYGQSGYRVDARRATKALYLGGSLAIYRRQTRDLPQGTVLIDASGSMRLDDQILRHLCNLAPGASVAYYDGKSKAYGVLYLYARDGSRADTIPQESHGHNNVIDGLALDWLLSQSPPYVLVSDLDFCDAPDSEFQILRASALRDAGVIEVHQTVERALAHFEQL